MLTRTQDIKGHLQEGTGEWKHGAMMVSFLLVSTVSCLHSPLDRHMYCVYVDGL